MHSLFPNGISVKSKENIFNSSTYFPQGHEYNNNKNMF